MKKALLALAASVVLLALIGLGYLVHLARSLNTPELQQALLEQARGALGTEISVSEMHLSLLEGVSLRGVQVANPPGFAGPLLTADAFRLRYDLLPLLRGRLQIDELVLVDPDLRIAMNARGVFNYEKLAPAKPAAGDAQPPAVSTPLPLELVLSRLAVENGQLSVIDHLKTPLLKAEGLQLSSAFTLSGESAQGAGEARLAQLGLAGRLFVRDVSAPIELSKQAVRLGPIRGSVAGGAAKGELRADLAGGFRYSLSLDLAGAQVRTLLQEARSTAALTGLLKAEGSFEGSGGLPTLKGRGRAEVSDCALRHSKLLTLLAATLQLPELAKPDFDECRVEFRLARSRVETPVLSMKGPALQLTGVGSLGLVDDVLAYDMTLALDKRLLGRVPVKEMRAAFREREDGLSALDFRLTGTSESPKTDIPARIGKAGATEAVKGALRKLFGKEKKKP